MRFFFADDSGRDGSRDGMGHLQAYGGYHVPDDQLGPLESEITAVLDDLSIPTDAEIKWSPRPGNPIRDMDADPREELYRRVLAGAADHDARAFVAVIDTGRTSIEGDEAHQWALRFVFERFNTDIAKREEWGVVIPDQPGGGTRQEREFLEQFLEMVQEGTDYSPGDRILLNALPTPSRFIRHLQVADLVTAVTTSMVGGDYTYAEPVFEEITPMLVRNAVGYIGGTGLKLFPDGLLNLYHWVLEEDAFTKARSGMGRPLPDDRYPYAEEDAARGA